MKKPQNPPNMLVRNEREWEQANEWFKLADELVEFVFEKTNGVYFEDEEQHAVQLLFMKGYKHYQAIVSLCKQGFGQDALLLTRIVLEISFLIKYIRQPTKKKERCERAKQFLVSELHEKKRFAKKLKEYHGNKYEIPSEFIDKIDVELRIWDNPERWQKRIAAIAKEIGEEKLYNKDYSYLSTFIHSNSFCLHWYVHQVDGGGAYFDTKQSDFAVLEAMHRGTLYFSGIMEQWKSLFGGFKKWELNRIIKKHEMSRYFQGKYQSG